MPHSNRRRSVPAACVLCCLVLGAADFLTTRWGLTSTGTAPLLGGPVSWRLSQWSQNTDVIQGGSSTANLRGSTDNANNGADFFGSLEASEVGAGWAGVTLKTAGLPQPITDFKALSLFVEKGDGRQYSVSLRALGSMGSFKFRFKADKPGVYEMPFKSFEPILRGKPAPQPAPALNMARVESITIEIESGQGNEKGPFELSLLAMEGILGKIEKDKGPPPRETRWVCRGCDTMNNVELKTCMRCGATREVERVEVVEKARAEAKRRSGVAQVAAGKISLQSASAKNVEDSGRSEVDFMDARAPALCKPFDFVEPVSGAA
eukprot:CAMPEP_0177342490 /NCGR_PEP_ID=MMETSP0368-20130122/27072_1 /TAXON_ID=447022 ORGANISM="Scrippsiella hangoei-like, Strain SHHI-4" /NCGR_SAMPLE_ID=MMETSP0368 /ASSEMBLY_ACC=CAM_ASM_000363 /LENGTH=319 /DNA_ID=CAMNT_0018803863 /DNA_START=28 /DNA_END=989 /DNA_ORIENTATION=+